MSPVIPFRRRSRYPFCQVSKQERRREWECAIIGIGGWKYDPRENREARDHVLPRSEEHTSELQSPDHLVCRLLLEKKKKKIEQYTQRQCILNLYDMRIH